MLPELETDRLIFREMQLSDSDELRAFQNRQEHWCLQAMEPVEYADGNRVQRYLVHRGDGPRRRLYAYVARIKASNAMVGEFGLTRLSNSAGSIGFSIAAEYWKQGFGTEVARRAVSYGFVELGLHRICADVAVENVASCRILEKIGMTREGSARDVIWAQARWWTEAQYAIIAGDKGDTSSGLFE